MSIYKGDNLIAGSGLNIDPIPTDGSQHTVMSGGVYTALLTKEDAANKTTVVDASSTDDQYPSAKAVYDALGTLNPVDIEYARDLGAPDWSQAVPITATQLVEGYIVPKRGIIVGSIIPNTYDVTGSPIIKINGVVVAYARGSSNEITHGSVQCPVCVNDRVSLEGISKEHCDAHISLVPYKRQ